MSNINPYQKLVVVNDYSLSILRKELPDHKIQLLPFARLPQSFKKSFLERKDIVFVGSYQHTPNVNAVKFFIQKIMPLLRQSLSGVRFYVVSSKPPLDFKELVCKVIITDFILDLTSFLNYVRLSVAPLRYGAGSKERLEVLWRLVCLLSQHLLPLKACL